MVIGVVPRYDPHGMVLPLVPRPSPGGGSGSGGGASGPPWGRQRAATASSLEQPREVRVRRLLMFFLAAWLGWQADWPGC